MSVEFILDSDYIKSVARHYEGSDVPEVKAHYLRLMRIAERLASYERKNDREPSLADARGEKS